ncbi:hypothetical protein EJB05_13100, partial [Eragrostis curvula]
MVKHFIVQQAGAQHSDGLKVIRLKTYSEGYDATPAKGQAKVKGTKKMGQRVTVTSEGKLYTSEGLRPLAKASRPYAKGFKLTAEQSLLPRDVTGQTKDL